MTQPEGETGVLSSAERSELGKALRAQTPRAAHGDWKPASNRRDPIAVLEASSLGRVPELIPIRYGRMLASPFAFLRGSAAVMAGDLAATPASGIIVQACGDCHLSNFGLFATPERNLVFDLNDFDETLPAPWEWDIKRLAASFVVVGRENNISESRCKAIVHVLADAYRTHLQEFAAMRVLDAWYARIDDEMLIATAPNAEVRQRREKIAAKARASVTEYLFPKISQVVDGRRRIVDQPPLVFHPPVHDDQDERVNRLMGAYHDSLPQDRLKLFERYRFQDYAFKAVGVGSVGTHCYVLLYLADDDDPLLLQVKEARPSVLEPYAGKGPFDHQGQRIVVGQRLVQAASDIFLGWTTGADGMHFYIRQLRDMKFSVPSSTSKRKGWRTTRPSAAGRWRAPTPRAATRR